MSNLMCMNVEAIKQKAETHPRTVTIHTARKKLKILKRDNFRCVECQSPDNLTIDHIKPIKDKKRTRPSSFNLDSCRVLCAPCHMKKNGWIPSQGNKQ